MTTRAHVLITTEVGQAASVAEGLRKLPGAQAADVVTGGYDIVLTLECTDVRDIGRVVLNQIHGMPGQIHYDPDRRELASVTASVSVALRATMATRGYP